MVAYSSISEVPPLRYSIIMADPPWRHVMRSPKGEGRSPSRHYKGGGMVMQDILDLPVSSLCQKDAWLWLWITAPFLNRFPEVLEAWGFTFVTAGSWGKVTKSQPIRPHIGNGFVLRECAEPYIIGKIGQPRVLDRGIPSLILEPKRENSRKPEAAYRHAARMVGHDPNKLDLFSRQEREGWDCMGDETDKFQHVTG